MPVLTLFVYLDCHDCSNFDTILRPKLESQNCKKKKGPVCKTNSCIIKKKMKKYFTVPGLLVLPAVRGCGWCKLIHDLDPTPVGFTWFWLVLKYANESTFTFSGYHTSWPHMTFDIHLWPLTLWTCESFHIISIMYHDSPIALCTSRSRSCIFKSGSSLVF